MKKICCTALLLMLAIFHSNSSAIAETYEVGSIVSMGHYEQDNNLYNGTEPLEWIVLAKDGTRALLITKNTIECSRYNEDKVDITWETCDLRKWLNKDFYNTAFSVKEQNMIDISELENPDVNGVDGGQNTFDKVFCLSEKELERYWPLQEDRIAYATKYTQEQEDFSTYKGNAHCSWWLRSPSRNEINIRWASDVYSDGSVGFDNIRCVAITVRPAIWIVYDQTDKVSEYGMTAYISSDLDMQISLPDDYDIFSRDMPASSPLLKKHGFTYNQMMDFLRSNDIYLDAVPSINVDHDIAVNSSIATISDYNLLDKDVLDSWMKNQLNGTDESTAIYSEYTYYTEHPQALFVRLIGKYRNTTNVLQYHTVYNNRFINITLLSFDGNITVEHENLMKKIVDSIIFPRVGYINSAYNNEIVEYSKHTFADIDPLELVKEPSLIGQQITDLVKGMVEGENYIRKEYPIEYEGIKDGTFVRYSFYPQFEYMGIPKDYTWIEIYTSLNSNIVNSLSYNFWWEFTDIKTLLPIVKDIYATLENEYGERTFIYYTSLFVGEETSDVTPATAFYWMSVLKSGMYHIQWYNGISRVTLGITIDQDSTYINGRVTFAD